MRPTGQTLAHWTTPPSSPSSTPRSGPPPPGHRCGELEHRRLTRRLPRILARLVPRIRRRGEDGVGGRVWWSVGSLSLGGEEVWGGRVSDPDLRSLEKRAATSGFWLGRVLFLPSFKGMNGADSFFGGSVNLFGRLCFFRTTSCFVIFSTLGSSCLADQLDHFQTFTLNRQTFGDSDGGDCFFGSQEHPQNTSNSKI